MMLLLVDGIVRQPDRQTETDIQPITAFLISNIYLQKGITLTAVTFQTQILYTGTKVCKLKFSILL